MGNTGTLSQQIALAGARVASPDFVQLPSPDHFPTYWYYTCAKICAKPFVFERYLITIYSRRPT